MSSHSKGELSLRQSLTFFFHVPPSLSGADWHDKLDMSEGSGGLLLVLHWDLGSAASD